MRKSQVTLFIIVGIVILFMVAFVAYLTTSDSDEQIHHEDTPTWARPVETFYKSCLDSVVDEGINGLSMRAGYYDLPLFTFNSQFGELPYFFFIGESLFPGVERFEREMEKYVNRNLDFCLRDFEDLEGFNVSMDGIDSNVNVGSNSIFVSLNQEANVTRGDASQTINFLEYSYDARIKDIYEISEKIVENKIRTPKFINITLIHELIRDYDIQIDTLTRGNNKVIYVLQDENNEIAGLPHMFLFATRTFETNFPPVILTERIEGVAGEPVTGNIEAEDEEMDRLTYYAEPLFIVGRYSGSYNFTIDEPGIYEVNVTVSDGQDDVTETIEVEIHED